MKTDNSIVIVVPCYNEEQVLPATIRQLTALMESSREEKQAGDYALLFVDDGSDDRTWSIISEAHEKNCRIKGLKLSANVGHQNALLAGLEKAAELGDAIISIDADLQDDIHAIPEMLKHYREGCDVVYGVRRSRAADAWLKRTTALTFYRLMEGLGVRSVYNHADFRLLSRRAVNALLAYPERNLYLRGLVPLLGYRSARVFYDRHPRLAGESKYPFRRMMAFAVDGITSFSVKPVRLVLAMGVAFVLISLLILIYVLHALVAGESVSGWASLMLSIWFVGGCVLIGLGVVGEYIGKIYLEVKGRPRYQVEEYTD